MPHISFGLLRCAYEHVFPMQYTTSILPRYGNRLENNNYECPVCKIKNLYLITQYDPSFKITNFIVGTFEKIDEWNGIDRLLSTNEDSIRKLLKAENYSLALDSTREHIIYVNPTGNKIVFKIKNGRKTQPLFVLSPEKDEIIAKIDAANKHDKRIRKSIALPKPIMPTKYKDFLGDELTIGDWVAYAQYNYSNLECGRIVKINEKTVSIKNKENYKSIAKSSSQIIKLSPERAMLLSLER